MGGQNEMGTLAYVQTATQVVTGSFQFLSLCHKQVGSNDTSVTDDVYFILGKYT